MVEPINYFPEIEMFIYVMLLQSKRIHELLFSHLQYSAAKVRGFILVTMVIDTPPSHLFIAPMRACV